MSAEYSSALEQLRAAIEASEAAAHRAGVSWPDLLRDAMALVDVDLTRTRPGAWEADHVRSLQGFEYRALDERLAAERRETAVAPETFICPGCGDRFPEDRGDRGPAGMLDRLHCADCASEVFA